MALRLTLLSVLLISVSFNKVVNGSSKLFPAMFVFGDSIVDNGNNIYLSSLAKANYMPYGIDFSSGPTGRFCNGKTIVDFLGDLLQLPLIPAFADPSVNETSIFNGINFASAAGGILEETGQNLGDRYSFSQHVQNFERALGHLKNQMKETKLYQYLAKSLLVVILGSNDYINNYLVPSLNPPSSTYNPADYADILINRYATQIQALQRYGFKKFLLGGVGPLGCIPNQIALSLSQPGQCISVVNDMVKMFNKRLVNLVDQLNNNRIESSVFVYGNTYDVFYDIIRNPSNYGFTVSDTGCCGIGRNEGQITCLPLQVPCMSRDEYVFWDAFHPTQAANKIVAQRAFTGPTSDCYPMNVQQMAKI